MSSFLFQVKEVMSGEADYDLLVVPAMAGHKCAWRAVFVCPSSVAANCRSLSPADQKQKSLSAADGQTVSQSSKKKLFRVAEVVK